MLKNYSIICRINASIILLCTNIFISGCATTTAGIIAEGAAVTAAGLGGWVIYRDWNFKDGFRSENARKYEKTAGELCAGISIAFEQNNIRIKNDDGIYKKKVAFNCSETEDTKIEAMDNLDLEITTYIEPSSKKSTKLWIYISSNSNTVEVNSKKAKQLVDSISIALGEAPLHTDNSNQTVTSMKQTGNSILPTNSSLNTQCRNGMEINNDTYGNCCYKGQVWNGSKCIGNPICPKTAKIAGNTCICENGKIFVPGSECCWPEQGWSQEKQECIGIPKCPPSYSQEDNNCIIEKVELGNNGNNNIQSSFPINWPGTPENPILREGEKFARTINTISCTNIFLLRNDGTAMQIASNLHIIQTNIEKQTWIFCYIPSMQIEGWIEESCLETAQTTINISPNSK